MARHRCAPKQEASLRRRFVTPEGVDLGLELGTAGERAGAFMIDAVAMLVVLILATIAIAFIADGDKSGVYETIWLLGFFALRNGWFTLFEMGGHAATPGKRLLSLRVVARDGGALTGGAVIARNALREVEVFLPLSFLGVQAADGTAGAFFAIFALAWSGIFLLFPLMNRDRLRIGDLLAGTWVIQTHRISLDSDLARAAVAADRRTFSDAALDLYGEYELQMLKDVLRRDNEVAIATVAGTIRRKAGLPDDRDDRGFLEDYYAALCARLERGMLMGRRRPDKTSAAGKGGLTVKVK